MVRSQNIVQILVLNTYMFIPIVVFLPSKLNSSIIQIVIIDSEQIVVE